MDFGLDMNLEEARATSPVRARREAVNPLRVNHREARQTRYWWLFARPCPDMREALAGLARFLQRHGSQSIYCFSGLNLKFSATRSRCLRARRRLLLWRSTSRFHEVWALGQGTQFAKRSPGSATRRQPALRPSRSPSLTTCSRRSLRPSNHRPSRRSDPNLIAFTPRTSRQRTTTWAKRSRRLTAVAAGVRRLVLSFRAPHSAVRT